MMNILADDLNIKFVKDLLQNGDKVLIILRGLPGSGKTTLARKFISNINKGIILSTDDYFNQNGIYNYMHEQLGQAHTWNQNRAKLLMQSHSSLVIIDNTNMAVWEMEPYIQMGKEFGYIIKILEPSTWWRRNFKILAEKNNHGVVKDAIYHMSLRYEKFDDVSLQKVATISETITQPKISKLNTKNTNKIIKKFNVLTNKHLEASSMKHSVNKHQISKSFQNFQEIHLKKAVQTSKYDFNILTKINNGILGLQTLKIIKAQKLSNFLISRSNSDSYLAAHHKLNQTQLTSCESKINEICDDYVVQNIDLFSNSKSLPNETTWVYKNSQFWDSPQQVSSTKSNLSKPAEVAKITSMIELLPRLDQIKPFYPSCIQNTSFSQMENEAKLNETIIGNPAIQFKLNNLNYDYINNSAFDGNSRENQFVTPNIQDFNYYHYDNPICIPENDSNQSENCRPNISRLTSPTFSYPNDTTSLLLDKKFLVKMQELYNIPPKPFDLDTLEFFDRSIDLDASLAQRLYFKWILAQERDPVFQETFDLPANESFIDDNTNNNYNYSSPTSYYTTAHMLSQLENLNNQDDHKEDNSVPFNLDAQEFPDCSCYFNPAFKNKLLSKSWDLLKPKPLTQIIQDEVTNNAANCLDTNVVGSESFSTTSPHLMTPEPTASESNLTELVPNLSVANLVKRTTLAKKFSDLDAHLLDEIFVGFNFDLEATENFVRSNISPSTTNIKLYDQEGGTYNQIIKREKPKSDLKSNDPQLTDWEDVYYNSQENDTGEENFYDFDVIYKQLPTFSSDPDKASTLQELFTRVSRHLGHFTSAKKSESPVPNSKIAQSTSNNETSTALRNELYSVLREDAFNLQKLRNEYLGKAAYGTQSTSSNKPFRSGIADYYRQTAQEYDKKSKDKNSQAVFNILCVNNYGQPINTLDLHGLHVSEVIPILKSYIAWAQSNIVDPKKTNSKVNKLIVITGRGKSRSSQHSRLNYIVRNYLQNKGYPPFEELTPGTFTLYLVRKS